MNKIIAACGLDCAACPAFIAAATNDQSMREKTAKEWSKAFGFDCRPEMVNCHGCMATDGVQIGHCAECEIRLCALGKGLSSCALCTDFGCAKAAAFWKDAPGARENLEALRG